MKAALVTAFDTPPRYDDVPEPVATGDHEVVVDVLAAGLHPRVRSQADGSHYTSDGVLPLVPGIDGVGRDPDGTVRYFVLDDGPAGSLAERTVVDLRRSVALPDGTDPVAVAAAMNPAMSSWVALRRRIEAAPGQDVLVLGATGSAGRLAVQVAGKDDRRAGEVAAVAGRLAHPNVYADSSQTRNKAALAFSRSDGGRSSFSGTGVEVGSRAGHPSVRGDVGGVG